MREARNTHVLVVALEAKPQVLGFFALRVHPFLHNGNAFAARAGLAHMVAGHHRGRLFSPAGSAGRFVRIIKVRQPLGRLIRFAITDGADQLDTL